jgi:hypothetical protein
MHLSNGALKHTLILNKQFQCFGIWVVSINKMINSYLYSIIIFMDFQQLILLMNSHSSMREVVEKSVGTCHSTTYLLSDYYIYKVGLIKGCVNLLQNQFSIFTQLTCSWRMRLGTWSRFLILLLHFLAKNLIHSVEVLH